MARIDSNDRTVSEDDRIVELLFNRDQQGIVLTEQKYRRYLYTVAYNIIKDREDCEECLNDVYLALWDSVPPHRPCSFKAYLTTLVRRAATDVYRKKKRLRRVPDEMESSLSELEFLLSSKDTPESRMESALLSDALNRFLSTVSKEERILFISRYYLCMSFSAISEATGIPKTSLRKKAELLKEKLKEYLKQEGMII